jgi:Zn-dependent peptidase ImmA (M78 family)
MRLANHLNVVVWNAKEIDGVSQDDLDQLIKKDSDSWSAFTSRIGQNNLIVFNPNQSEARINSVIMHELSHIILGHKLADVLTTPDGQVVPSHYDQGQEDEADWLAGTLLLPRPLLLKVVGNKFSNYEICSQYLVSKQMLEWRVRMTGIRHQLRHRRY